MSILNTRCLQFMVENVPSYHYVSHLCQTHKQRETDVCYCIGQQIDDVILTHLIESNLEKDNRFWHFIWGNNLYCNELHKQIGITLRVICLVDAYMYIVDTSLSPIRRGFAPRFVNYKKSALDSQPQVIKLTSCLLLVDGSLRMRRLLPPLKLVTMI